MRQCRHETESDKIHTVTIDFPGEHKYRCEHIFVSICFSLFGPGRDGTGDQENEAFTFDELD